MNNTSSSSSISVGGGFPGLLAIAFIVMKLTGYITWSWWWVLSPLWIPVGLGVSILIVIGILAVLLGK
jgi:hypothetical protein